MRKPASVCGNFVSLKVNNDFQSGSLVRLLAFSVYCACLQKRINHPLPCFSFITLFAAVTGIGENTAIYVSKLEMVQR